MFELSIIYLVVYKAKNKMLNFPFSCDVTLGKWLQAHKINFSIGMAVYKLY